MAVIDLLGKPIETLQNGYQEPGNYQLQFSAKELGQEPGVYFLFLELDNRKIIKRIVELQ